ncbi:MAG TPA: sigma 54-interacting transcriptional regulator, partial [Fimbriiglobus sp.]|nr:sigma 54-interacting transcriptional regulator [Fimbriiglobus sp.]
MSDPAPPEPDDRPRFAWRAFFHKATVPVFVVGPTRRLRYANPAWEKLTSKPLAKVRGMRVSARRSASPLGQVLAAPPEVWAGQTARSRRPVPPAEVGPPWWDVTFVPLPGDGRMLGVIGLVAPVGEPVRGGPKVSPALADLRRKHAAAYPFELFAGSSTASERLLSQVRLAAQVTAPVWIVGEPGTGKETLARVIHHNGPTREKAFLGLDCAGLQPALVESLLFGKGGLAGSGQLGTVYLKDPAALPANLQDRLAGWLTADKADLPRLICGSTRTAADEVRGGRLIPLFHTALAVLELRVPPLRERLDDLPTVVDRLLDRFPTKPVIAEDIWPVLRSYDWPANLRELADELGQAVRRAEAGPVTRDHLPRFVREKHLLASEPHPAVGRSWTLDGVL